MRRGIGTAGALLAVGTATAWAGPAPAQAPTPATCAPGGAAATLTGTATATDAETYLELPFDVAEGTTRVEVTYDWVDVGRPEGGIESVLDLGLWDADGDVGDAEAFRGWSGSRAGRVTDGQEPVFVQPDVASRGYLPDRIGAGTWHVDVGIAVVDPAATVEWTVTVTCTDPAVGPPFVEAPVDPDHVARTEAGWYLGDFHMHGFHSNAEAPDPQAMVDEAVAAGLDFLPITEYVTGQHWRELGPVQAANPDTLLVPGREIITYDGHVAAIGETPSVLEYRVGAPGVTLGAIQEATVADGALFQIEHPTTFPEAEFPGLCRGCEFALDDQVDWDLVDTYEVFNTVPSPFVATALAEWQSLLAAGHRITAVSGSDSKGVEDDPDRRWGSTATAVYAEELSRAALFDAVRAGHAYIRTLGADGSPELEFTATAGTEAAIVGDSLDVETAAMSAVVRGGGGQVLLVTRDGQLAFDPVPITGEEFTHTWTADRDPASGPLGTSWRVDVATIADPQVLTVISNPIFLGPVDEPEATTTSAPRGPQEDATPTAPEGRDEDEDDGGGAPLVALVAVAIVVLAAGAAVVARRSTGRTHVR